MIVRGRRWGPPPTCDAPDNRLGRYKQFRIPSQRVGWDMLTLGIGTVRLSHTANGSMASRRSVRRKTALPYGTWLAIESLASVCPILQPGVTGTCMPAVGCKALNASLLGGEPPYSPTNSFEGEPEFFTSHFALNGMVPFRADLTWWRHVKRRDLRGVPAARRRIVRPRSTRRAEAG